MGLKQLNCLVESQSQVGVSSGKSVRRCDHAPFLSWWGWTCCISVSLREESFSLHLIMLQDTVQADIWGFKSGKEMCSHLLYSFV